MIQRHNARKIPVCCRVVEEGKVKYLSNPDFWAVLDQKIAVLDAKLSSENQQKHDDANAYVSYSTCCAMLITTSQ
jgi:hypothetical protein